MENVLNEKEIFAALARLVALQFGRNCEVVIHDLTGEYDHTIAIIENGHVTGRKVGDCGSNLGLEVLRGTVDKGDRFGYITHTQDGKILRSSTIYIKNPKGAVIGAICVNLDISGLIMANRMLREFVSLDDSRAIIEADRTEVFANDVNQLLEALLRDALAEIGKPVAMMTREDKIRAIAHLDARGAFLVSKAGGKVCKHLNISKYTLYSYLEEIHNSQSDRREGPGGEDTPPPLPGRKRAAPAGRRTKAARQKGG